MKLLTIVLLSFSILLTSACSTGPKKKATEQELYEDARQALRLRNFQQSLVALEALESDFPFGKYAEQAQLDLVYARYSALDLDGSISAADRFIRLHPQSPNVDYAYYMRGIANFHLDTSIASEYFSGIDASSRDPGNMRQAFQDFTTLIKKYPDSRYANDAQKRMISIRNRLAKYELHAARYYIKREAYLAALNRATHVVQSYPKTPSVEIALEMMVELQAELGLKKQAEQSLSVLKLNYPNNNSLTDDGQFEGKYIKSETRSLLSVMTFGVLE